MLARFCIAFQHAVLDFVLLQTDLIGAVPGDRLLHGFVLRQGHVILMLDGIVDFLDFLLDALPEVLQLRFHVSQFRM
jgi:hypothetical protein